VAADIAMRPALIAAQKIAFLSVIVGLPGVEFDLQLVVQIFSVFIPVSASVRDLNVFPSTVTSVVVIGFLSTMVHFFVFFIALSWKVDYNANYKLQSGRSVPAKSDSSSPMNGHSPLIYQSMLGDALHP